MIVTLTSLLCIQEKPAIVLNGLKEIIENGKEMNGSEEQYRGNVMSSALELQSKGKLNAAFNTTN